VRVGTLLAVLDDDGLGAENREPRTENREPRTNGDSAETQNSKLKTQNLNSHTYTGPISPVVARLAAEHNLDLGAISGTGQGGRVTKQDVLKYIEARGKEPTPSAKRMSGIAAEPPATAGPRAGAPVEPPILAPSMASVALPQPSVESVSPSAQSVEPLPEDAELLPVSPMRRAIAEHMVRSRQTAPHVTTVFEIDVSRVAAHRERRKVDFERQGVKLTYTPYFVQAAVAALQATPSVNGSYGEGGIVLHNRIHIGVAVALDEGLIVPVVRDADEKNLLGLARAVNDLSERARARRLRPDEAQGGTFTITNHGVSGSLFATPIINQPQAAILGVGAIQKRAVVITHDDVDAIAIRPMCYVSLTIDHRLLDGTTADKFLTVIKAFLERYGE
jgi:2-oxoisovalerate dehydrogenase E2 component (dihydrolipoyl transacylase)